MSGVTEAVSGAESSTLVLCGRVEKVMEEYETAVECQASTARLSGMCNERERERRRRRRRQRQRHTDRQKKRHLNKKKEKHY